jgi:hypothetical protein
MRLRRSSSLLLFPVLLLACSDSATAPETVHSVEITPADPSLRVGDTQQLTAIIRGASGNVLTGREVKWTSSHSSVATVDDSGLLTGVGVGMATITASTEGRNDKVTVEVTSATLPAITAISADSLVEGATVTLQGENFDPSPQNNVVRIGGVRATVNSASATSLQIVVPAACLPTGPAAVTVTVGGSSSRDFLHPYRGPTPLNLRIGEQAIFRSPRDLCVPLAANSASERYVIGVQSISEVLSSLTPVQLTASIPGATSTSSSTAEAAGTPAHTRAAAPHRHTAAQFFSFRMGARENRWARHRRSETAIRAQERVRMPSRLQQRPQRLGALRALHTASATSQAPPSVGDTLNLRVPDISRDLCDHYLPVRAVVRVAGARGIWLEDVENPAGGYTPQDYEQLSQLFDETIYPTNVSFFGEPTDLDDNNRILILTTKEINRINAADNNIEALGFVVSSDFAERGPGGCASSNRGEIFYGVAPDPDNELGWEASEGRPYDREMALEDAPTLIAHEFTHIIQFGRRILPEFVTFPSIWEMEGQAQLAEEVVGHAANGREPRQDLGFNVAFNPQDWPQAAPVSWYVDSFVDLMLYFGYESRTARVPNAPEQCSWVGRDRSGDNNGPCLGRHVYGVPWSLLRWVADHFGANYAGGEQELQRRLIENRSLSGFANLEALTGVRADTLLAQWAAALYVDGRFPTLDERLTFPSWNLYEIFEIGLAEVNNYTTATLSPRERGFGAFQDQVSVRAGSTAYFVVSGGNRPATAIGARTPTGAALPGNMQLWVVRVE